MNLTLDDAAGERCYYNDTRDDDLLGCLHYPMRSQLSKVGQ